MPLYANAQWAVTEDGLDSVLPGAPYLYEIDAARLLERDQGGSVYDWPGHMAEKTWIDIDLFIEAFDEALKHHKGKYDGVVDPAMMANTIAEARPPVAIVVAEHA